MDTAAYGEVMPESKKAARQLRFLVRMMAGKTMNLTVGIEAPSRSVSPTGTRTRKMDSMLAGILALMTFALFVRTASFDFLDYDDAMYVSANWHVRTGLSFQNLRWALTDTSSANWHPATTLTYLLLSTVFGTKPAAFHIANALLHSVNVALLYVFLRRTTSQIWPSAIVAMLWGFHPQRVESVAWIAELKDVLCGLFWLSCVLAYARYHNHRTIARYLAVVGFLIMALLSKPMAVTLPAALLLLDFWPLQTPWNLWRILEKLPLAMLSLATCAVAIYTQRHRGATRSIATFSMSVRFQNALLSYCSYVGKTFLPRHLSIFYPHPVLIGEEISRMHWIGASILLVAVTWFVFLQRHRRAYLFMGWVWFLITLLPVIGLVQVGDQAMADRYSYLPSTGLIIAVVWFVDDVLKGRRAGRNFMIETTAAGCIMLIVATTVQLKYWRNQESVFAHANAVTRKNYVARASLAWVYMRDPQRREEALKLARSAVNIYPQWPSYLVLAVIMQEQGLFNESLAMYQQAISLDPYNAVAHGHFGTLLVKMGRDTSAIKQFRQAIELNPTDADARHNLAICLANHQQLDEAIAEWQMATQFAPSDGTIHGWLAEALRVRGDRAGAIFHYRAALAAGERNPLWAANLAWLVATDPASSAHDLDQAVSIANNASAFDGKERAGALDAMAIALSRLGRVDDAVVTAEAAVAAANAHQMPKLAAEIRSRLRLYRLGEQYTPTSGSLPTTQ